MQRINKANLYRDAHMKQPDYGDFLDGILAVYSRPAPPREDKINEDCVALIPHGEHSGVIAVADGMGGGPDGELASRMTIECVQHALRAADEGQESLREIILDSIEAANQKIIGLSNGAGSTVSIVEIQGNTVRPYHVGDSMILVTGQRGKIKLQTLPHAPISYAVESGLMEEVEAVHHDDRHLVSNFLGSTEMRIEIGPKVELAAKDTLVVASDGLGDNYLIDEIVQRIRKGSLEKVAENLTEESVLRMTEHKEGRPGRQDDLSFV